MLVDALNILKIYGSILIFISLSSVNFLVLSFNFLSTQSLKSSPAKVYITFAMYPLCRFSTSATSTGKAKETSGCLLAHVNISAILNPWKDGTWM
jgi:hypothetical protein